MPLLREIGQFILFKFKRPLSHSFKLSIDNAKILYINFHFLDILSKITTVSSLFWLYLDFKWFCRKNFSSLSKLRICLVSLIYIHICLEVMEMSYKFLLEYLHFSVSDLLWLLRYSSWEFSAKNYNDNTRRLFYSTLKVLKGLSDYFLSR